MIIRKRDEMKWTPVSIVNLYSCAWNAGLRLWIHGLVITSGWTISQYVTTTLVQQIIVFCHGCMQMEPWQPGRDLTHTICGALSCYVVCMLFGVWTSFYYILPFFSCSDDDTRIANYIAHSMTALQKYPWPPVNPL